METFINISTLLLRMVTFFDPLDYVPKSSLRDLLVWEMHASELAGHLGQDKTVVLVRIDFTSLP